MKITITRVFVLFFSIIDWCLIKGFERPLRKTPIPQSSLQESISSTTALQDPLSIPATSAGSECK